MQTLSRALKEAKLRNSLYKLAVSCDKSDL